MGYGSITRPADFPRLMRSGRRTERGPIVIHTGRGESEQIRLGMAVRAPRAVDRNRIKRRLRAAVRAAEGCAGTDLLIRTSDAALATPFQELVTAIEGACAEVRR